MEIVSLLLYLRDRHLGYLAGEVFLGIVRAFAGEALVLGEIFSHVPIFGMDIEYLFSSKPKNLYFYRGFTWEQTFPIG